MFGVGGPARHEKRARRNGERRRRGVGVSDREKEGELNAEHPEGIEEEVAPVGLHAKGGEDVFAENECLKSQEEDAGTR